MGAVFVASQQDGCCFVLAPCTVNILQQTQLQVAHWLSHGSWAGLQGPINGDINKEGWGGVEGGAWGLVPLPEKPSSSSPQPQLEAEGLWEGQKQPPFCSAVMLEQGWVSHQILPQFPQVENR